MNLEIGKVTFRISNCNLQSLIFKGEKPDNMLYGDKHRCPNCGATKLYYKNCKYCGT